MRMSGGWSREVDCCWRWLMTVDCETAVSWDVLLVGPLDTDWRVILSRVSMYMCQSSVSCSTVQGDRSTGVPRLEPVLLHHSACDQETRPHSPTNHCFLLDHVKPGSAWFQHLTTDTPTKTLLCTFEKKIFYPCTSSLLQLSVNGDWEKSVRAADIVVNAACRGFRFQLNICYCHKSLNSDIIQQIFPNYTWKYSPTATLPSVSPPLGSIIAFQSLVIVAHAFKWLIQHAQCL